MTSPSSIWAPRPLPRVRYYTVDEQRFLVYYRGWSLSLTLGWPMLHEAMGEIDRLFATRYDG